MNRKAIVALTLVCALLPSAAVAGRGGGGMGGARMGGMSRPTSVSRPSGGFNMSADAPKSGSRTNTRPGGTTRTTNYAYGENGYARTTTATNGEVSRTGGGAYNANTGNFAHGTSSSSAYGNRTGSTRETSIPETSAIAPAAATGTARIIRRGRAMRTIARTTGRPTHRTRGDKPTTRIRVSITARFIAGRW